MDHLDPSWGLGNADLIQQLATLRWIKEGDQGKKYMENVTQLRVGYELWQRVSGQRELDALRNQTILSISKYVKDYPRASKEQLAAEVARQIQEFANKVENL